MRNALLFAVLCVSVVACAPPYSDSEPAPAPAPKMAPVEVLDADPADMDALKARLATTLPNVKVDMVRPTPLPGIYEIQSGFNFGYVSLDGRFLIEGDLNDLATGQRMTEDRRRGARMALVGAMGANQVIEYAPKNVATKHTVTVFTDIDCGYCRKLHQQIAEYNADGIAVRYLFFPRSGPDTESFHKAEKVWCAADRKSALTQAKLGSGFEGPNSCANPILDHLKLAGQLGLRGTPAIILPDGELIPGYQAPDDLVKILADHGAPAARPG